MQQITVDIPDDIAVRLATHPNDLPTILALGLQAVQASPSDGLSGLTEVLEFLATLPSPQEILTLRLSPPLQAELDALLEKNRTTGLNAVEKSLWKHYEYIEHLVRVAKARALLKIKLKS